MKILIDNGHGVETLGKRSPDGRLQERSYTRLIAREIVFHLTAAGLRRSWWFRRTRMSRCLNAAGG